VCRMSLEYCWQSNFYLSLSLSLARSLSLSLARSLVYFTHLHKRCIYKFWYNIFWGAISAGGANRQTWCQRSSPPGFISYVKMEPSANFLCSSAKERQEISLTHKVIEEKYSPLFLSLFFLWKSYHPLADGIYR
jgi:hypothetical protein